MLDSIRKHLSYANVMATMAVFIALGGSAFAAATISGGDVEDGSLSGDDVKNNSLTSEDVKLLKIGDFKDSERAKLRGPVGPRGAKGTKGNTGAKGAAGPSALQVHYRRTAPHAEETLFTVAGMTVTAECTSGDDFVTLRAKTDTANSILGVGPVSGNPYMSPTLVNPGTQNDWDPGEVEEALVDDTATVLSYGRGPDSTPVVTATFLANKFTTTGECKVVGTVIGG